jgi:hypothetical protein
MLQSELWDPINIDSASSVWNSWERYQRLFYLNQSLQQLLQQSLHQSLQQSLHQSLQQMQSQSFKYHPLIQLK